MKNMEREKFEESFRDAFEKAEVSPSDRAWVNIELELEKAKGGDLKRRLMFYQMLAAASVVFAMAIAGGSYYSHITVKESYSESVASKTSIPDAEPSQADPKAVEKIAGESPALSMESTASSEHIIASNPHSGRESKSQLREEARVRNDNRVNERTGGGLDDGVVPTASVSSDVREHDQLPLAVNDRHLPALYTPAKIDVNMHLNRAEAQEVDPVVAMMARLARREREMRDEDQHAAKETGNVTEKLWTSIGFAAGSFNTVQASGAGARTQMNSMSFVAAPIVDQETKASGYAYSMGVNIGTKLSERWVLQGGVNYLANSTDYTANNIVVTSAGPQQQHFRAATTKEVLNNAADELDNKILYSAPYNVNNSMRYLSIPMQAGYLLIDKTFALQLNAGVATDLFLQNTVTPDSENLDKTTQTSGSDSPYRTFNLSGLFGTELSYRFSERYRLSLTPGIRYPFSTIYKSALGVDDSPLTFDVGLRFRYIFH
jgi:hypothetical protein